MKKTIKKVVEVFDLRKYIDVCLDNRQTAVEIVDNIKYWALKHNGATQQELEDKGYHISSDWCIKKEIEIEVPINELCTPFEKELLRKVDKEHKDGCVARDKDDEIAIYTHKPIKDIKYDMWNTTSDDYFYLPFTDVFPFITWEDEEPYKISELIG